MLGAFEQERCGRGTIDEERVIVATLAVVTAPARIRGCSLTMVLTVDNVRLR